MGSKVIFKRKMYDKLLDWKKEYDGSRAVLIEGARRVGKTTVVMEFAKKEYEAHIFIDFSNCSKKVLQIFRDSLDDIDVFFNKLQFETGVMLKKRKSVIIFDEVQLFPYARQMIKHLVADGRYDYIETGSLISLKKNIDGILIPSEEIRFQMYPMDFEEFLWAKGDLVTVPYIKSFFDKRQPLGDVAHRTAMNRYREYMMVGGMPAVVEKYIQTKDIPKTDEVKREILSLYEEDMGKIPGSNGIKASRIFEKIPSFLSKHIQYFSPGEIEKDSRTRSYLDAIQWLKESKIVNVCTSTTDVSVFSKMYLDDNRFKCYLLDTGLLISEANPKGSKGLNDVYHAFLFGKLSENLGMFYENMVAQELVCSGHELVFFVFKKDDSDKNYEVDFIISDGKKVIPIEVKSRQSTTHASLDHMIDIYGKSLGERFVVHTKDLFIDKGITYVPIYMAMFL